MEKKDIENRIKELELELSILKTSEFDVQKLQENDQRFRNLVELSIYPILILKGEDMILETANNPILKIFNVGKEALGKSLIEILPEMKDQPFMGLLFDVLHNNISHYGSEQPAFFIRDNGENEIVYFDFVYHPYKENDGTVSGVLVYATDVTERVLVRKKAEENEQRFRLATEASGVGIWEWNVITNQIKWDAKMFEIYGVKPTNNGFVPYDTWKEALVTEDIEEQEKILQVTVKNSGSSKRFFKILRADDGILRHIEAVETVRTNDAGQAEWIVGTNIDVTEQVLARKKVEESEHRFHQLIYSSPYMIGIFKGKDTIIEIANDAIIETWGKGKDIIGKSLFEVLPEAAEQGFDKLIQNVYETGEPYHAYETPVTLLRNGKQQLMHYNFIYQAQRNINGEIVGVAILANEVTYEVIAKQKIKDSQQQLQNIFMQAPFALNIYEGKEFVISLANKLFCEIIGKTESEILGRKLFDAFPETATQGLDKILSDIFSTGIPFKGNEFPVHFLKHGNEFKGYFDFIYHPIFDYNKNVSGVINVAIDVTDKVLARKKIEESEEQLRKISEHFEIATTAAEVGTWSLDLASQTLEWSDLHKKMWGYDEHRTDLVYEDWHKVILDSDKEVVYAALAKTLETKIHYETSYRIKREDNENVRWMRASGKYLYNDAGEAVTLSGISMDITEQKRIEEKLIVAKESAENAVKFKQQFLSNMSHEIRTPLNSIVGFTNVLLKTELDEKQKEFLKAIKTSSNSLNVLINDILDLAKVDAGKMTFEKKPFEMCKSINSLIHSFDLKIKEKNLELVREYDSKIPSIVIGDSVRLNQIILNLMSNAIKFTHNGKIMLSANLKNEDEKNVFIEFVITDTGIGIANDKINSIFNLFEQAEINTSNSYGGTGLGLGIVKQLVELQGGSIQVNSKLGEGSTFSFIMPFAKTNKKIVEKAEIVALNSKIKNLRVLVAEDVALNQLLIKIILDDFDFDFDIVNNGKLAIEKLQTNTYDIILMDLQMPIMNGFEATEYIRNTMQSTIPIIALTADVTTVDDLKCKELGMNDYISKPFDENQLYSKIVALIER
ncbi:PAS domain S-box protein [Flavobacterium sp.]|uniref:PAS domain S-box protein n=1 Tax=Flavobacterium sp. TaxID=239 RepID=UPI00286EA9C0|nr:PAS domain S-box protein [Flavobacterium sp.]